MTTVKQLMDMTGYRALITGAAGQLGRVMADAFAELGVELILLDREGSELKKISDDLANRWGTHIQTIFCDLEIPDERSRVIHSLTQEGKPLHVLVNNAAFVGTSDLKGWAVPFEQQGLQAWRRALEVNLTSAFDLCQGLVPLLKSSGFGSIVNIASIYGEFGPDWSLYEGTAMSNPAAYSASKGGLLQLTRWLSTTLAPQIRVNSISPGGIARGQPSVFVERYEANTPMRRMAREDDIRGAVVYLSSKMSSYVTGQNLRVDGGWGIW